MKTGFRIGEEFGPAHELKSLYYLQIILMFALLVLPWLIPMMLFLPLWITLIPLAFVLPFFLFGVLWVHLYYPTVVYRLTNSEITWKRGVWFRTTGIVQYNRITNVDIRQGPLARAFGLSSLHIQTAGYSAANARAAEISIDGVKNPDEIRDAMMAFVRGGKPVAAETYSEDDKVLGELVKIRKLLEKKK